MTDARTIAAISTPPGKGGVALIRISGSDAFKIADKCFCTYGALPLSARPPRTAVRGDIVLDGTRIDDGVAFCFPAPHSYTGEDTVEITCHGGMLVTRAVLDAVIAAGASPAGPGEFTRRAYINGHLTLTEAEAIGNLLEASSMGQIKIASRESRTHLSRALAALHDETVLLLSSLFACIDYPEEDLAEFSNEELGTRLAKLLADMDKLLATYRTGRTVAEGIRTVLCGRPNVGKSSLYNLLCHEDAAIVTDVAGTTRDVLERCVPLGDMTLRLYDTAGLHETNDPVEKIGVERSRDQMQHADLILAVFDGSAPLEDEDFALLSTLKDCDAIALAILNKSDLGEADMTPVYEATPHVITLSAKKADISRLTDLITTLFTDGTIRIGEDAILTGARQFAALTNARNYTDSCCQALLSGIPADIACSELERALGALAELDGRMVSEEVVAGIFSHFCVGK